MGRFSLPSFNSAGRRATEGGKGNRQSAPLTVGKRILCKIERRRRKERHGSIGGVQETAHDKKMTVHRECRGNYPCAARRRMRRGTS